MQTISKQIWRKNIFIVSGGSEPEEKEDFKNESLNEVISFLWKPSNLTILSLIDLQDEELFKKSRPSRSLSFHLSCELSPSYEAIVNSDVAVDTIIKRTKDCSKYFHGFHEEMQLKPEQENMILGFSHSVSEKEDLKMFESKFEFIHSNRKGFFICLANFFIKNF